MTKFIGNRIGFGVTFWNDQGLFNIAQQYHLKQDGRWGPFVSASATGSVTVVQNPTNSVRYHIFKGNGTFTVTNGGMISYTIIGGGGGGGFGWGGFTDTAGGGGGGGGFRSGLAEVFPGPYAVSIGSGGPGFLDDNGAPSYIAGPASFTTIESAGGGKGGQYAPSSELWKTPGKPGGSGGGGSGGNGYRPRGTGNSPPVTPPQGSNGGVGNWAGGGGGGADIYGEIGSPSTGGGDGGDGRSFGVFPGDSLPSAYGVNGKFAGGGGGGAASSAPTLFGNGKDGGGDGGYAYRPPSTTYPPSLHVGDDGVVNTGGGGGGGGSRNFPSPTRNLGGAGGPGIIIIGYYYYGG